MRVAHNGGVTHDWLYVDQVEGREGNVAMRGSFPLGVDNPSTYGAWMAPGEYRFIRLLSPSDAYRSGGVIDLEGMLPNFFVESGKLTDLGTLVQQPVGENRVTVVQWNAPSSFGQARHNEDFDEAAPMLAGPPIRWDGTVQWSYKDAAAPWGISGGLIVALLETQRERTNMQPLNEQWARAGSPHEIVQLSKQAAMAMERPVFDADGNAYFGSSLGQVLRRSAEGQWTNLDTGVMDSLSAVYVEGPHIYVGSRDGRLLFSEDSGASWIEAPSRVAEAIAGIERMPNGDFLVATAATAWWPRVPRKNATVLRGPDFLALPATPWITLEAEKEGGGDRTRPTSMSLVGQRLHVWVWPKSMFVYDLGSDTLSGSEADYFLGQIYVNEVAGLVYSGGTPGGAPFIPLVGLLSTDGGATWAQTKPGNNVGLGFRDALNGITVRVEGGRKIQQNVATTVDGGKTWIEVGKMPGVCRAAAYLPPTDELICQMADGNIISTRTGAEWVVERLTNDSALVGAQ